MNEKHLDALVITPVEANLATIKMMAPLSSAVETLIKTAAAGAIPEIMPEELCKRPSFIDIDSIDNSMVPFMVHRALGDLGFYARITKDVARNFRKILPEDAVVLDPMAGKGYNVKALREAGIPTIGSDNGSWDLANEALEVLDARESLRKYGHEITHLLIAWAPYEEEIDFELLEICREEFPHITIINIGEGEGGCTGGYKFSSESEVIEYPSVGYRNTHGINDYVSFVK